VKIAIGSDHAGFRYKGLIIGWLREAGHDVDDFGTNSTESVDYPLFIRPVAEAVAIGDYERGIVLGGSGNGEAIVANRIRGIRCTICWNVDAARFARAHNDSNVLSLGERLIPEGDLRQILETWLSTPFEGGRHLQRIEEIDGLADDSAKDLGRGLVGGKPSALPRE
jgi:ribose 5-phosphate isomerase B